MPTAFKPELLFFVPILGYALAYAYEAGAYKAADAPSIFIVVSIAHIFLGCMSVVVPLLSVGYASSKSSRRIIDRGWSGALNVLFFSMLGYSPLVVYGIWKDDASALYFGVASGATFAAVVLLYVVRKSPGVTKFFDDHDPTIRNLLAIGVVTLVAVFFAAGAGMIAERSRETYTVLDNGCITYTRVFRTIGDTVILFPAYRGVGNAYELVSLSSRGLLRLKDVSREEYRAALAMVGPCAR
ncbi:hypothetical protein LP085_08860 [Achromobacter sp. MY14]|uniref:hypothetical protein n=1 Tax=unclassified Achromobacter TaxID=2626865 RepID=UPI001E37835B|nr:hypothetical protein [Achromobacter sp. MY14]MCD0496954.1 hypothetical protein [Achromobacter sp. MY14]